MFNYGHYSFRENLLEIRCVCSVKLPINCAAWSDLKHAQQNMFPMRFFIEMGRNVPIVIGHSYVSWGTLKAEQNKSRRMRKLTICIGENKGAGSASQ